MVLHSRPKERLFASGSTSRRQGEDCVLDSSNSCPLSSATFHRHLRG
jgi:hypothetical protein